MKALHLVIAILFSLSTSALYAKNEKNDVVESTIIYKVKQNATPSQLEKLQALITKNAAVKQKQLKGSKTRVAKFKNIKGQEEGFCQELMNTGALEYATPDVVIQPQETAADDSGGQWHHSTIGSPIAWDYTTGPSDPDAVKVCVLDSGIDTDHPDLIDNIQLPGYNAYLKVTGNIEDTFGHGTAVAGVIGAVGNNGLGVSGMAWSIQIIPVKVTMESSSSTTLFTVAHGIEWCADQGAKVVNLSYDVTKYSLVHEAAQYLRSKGGLLFVPTGNSGNYYDTASRPDYDSYIAVGSSDQSDARSSFSSYGPYVDVVAPGRSIYTTGIGGYVSATGTSYASPMVAGLAALIYSINPEFTPEQVEGYIFQAANDFGDAGEDDQYGHGRIDAGGSVTLASDGDSGINTPPTAVVSVSTTSGTAPLTVVFDGSGSTDEDGQIIGYQWNFGDGHTGDGATATHTFATIGTYNVTLTVTDNDAGTAVSTPVAIEVTPDLDAINTPTELSSDQIEGTYSVELAWTNNTIYDIVYEIYRAKKKKGKFNFELIDTITADSSSYLTTIAYVDSDLKKGKYKYKVRAKLTYNGQDYYSAFSNKTKVKVKKVKSGKSKSKKKASEDPIMKI